MDPLITYISLRLTRILLQTLDFVVEKVAGFSFIYGPTSERQKAEKNGLQAQLVKIRARAIPLKATLRYHPECYLVTHEKYVKADYVLKV